MGLRVACVIALAIVAPLAIGGSAAARSDAGGRRTFVLGRSLRGRPIVGIEVGDLGARRRALIVGCIHGNEQAGIAIARWLAATPPPKGVDLWVVPVLNPDGVAAGTRGNGEGVDLNRNFPWRWRRLEGVYFSGPRPLSEPESRVAYR